MGSMVETMREREGEKGMEEKGEGGRSKGREGKDDQRTRSDNASFDFRIDSRRCARAPERE